MAAPRGGGDGDHDGDEDSSLLDSQRRSSPFDASVAEDGEGRPIGGAEARTDRARRAKNIDSVQSPVSNSHALSRYLGLI